MKLEHRKQELLPLPAFFLRLVAYFIFALLVIIVSVFIGVMGYHHFGSISWIDSFHMACMILTGMGPVVEMKTDSAKIFSSLYALYSGVAFLSITAVMLAPVIHRLLHILHIENAPEK